IINVMQDLVAEEESNFSTDQDVLVFGQRLRHLRRAAGLTLVELGERVGRAPSQLSLLENGHREPKLSLLRALADALGTSVDELRATMREHGNYFPRIERAASGIVERVGYQGGALSEGLIQSIATHLGYGLRFVTDLPRSVRSVTDLRHRRIFLRRESLGMHS